MDSVVVLVVFMLVVFSGCGDGGFGWLCLVVCCGGLEA